MPVTKKKGAIFAIYADSPTQPSTFTSGSSTTRLRLSSPHSPTKRSIPRKALISIPPKPINGFPISTSSALKSSDVKSTPRTRSPSVNPKPHRVRSSSTSHPPPPAPRTAPSKRQIEIFSSPSQPLSSILPSQREPPSGTHPSPAKRGRATPAKLREDKENQAPSSSSIRDSPASRTRSKVRARADSLVGNGRETLTLKKGRALASLLAGEEAGNSPGFASGGKSSRDVHVGTWEGEGKSRRRSAKAVEPLADVSEAYGASGTEPLGFREVHD
ncbi:MAG: hypothetical protein TREMPRED_003773 [Tremellales sp. Tagirdzhanova-0007]|nr:MAG: hypothetical protein TREMPRED_003773 [Tremellales sp. Tagirdzhanova-0007]